MTLHSVKQGMADTEHGMMDYKPNPDISEDIQQTLSRIMGWSEDVQKYIDLRTDSIGRLQTVPASVSNENLSAKTIVSGAGETLLLNPNPYRKFAMIYANYTGTLSHGFRAGDANTVPLIVAAPVLIKFYGYNGAFYVFDATGGFSFSVVEV